MVGLNDPERLETKMIRWFSPSPFNAALGTHRTEKPELCFPFIKYSPCSSHRYIPKNTKSAFEWWVWRDRSLRAAKAACWSFGSVAQARKRYWEENLDLIMLGDAQCGFIRVKPGLHRSRGWAGDAADDQYQLELLYREGDRRRGVIR